MMQASTAEFQECTTSALIKEKLDIEYIAQMSSIEGISPAEEVAQRYMLLKEEIERRESAYRNHCSQIRLNSAIHDWLLVIGKRSLQQLLLSLAGRGRAGYSGDLISLNPKNLFFREIILRRKGPNEDALESALFVLGCAIPLVWIQEKFHNIRQAPQSSVDDIVSFEVDHAVAERKGKLRFYIESNQDKPMVAKVLIQL